MQLGTNQRNVSISSGAVLKVVLVLFSLWILFLLKHIALMFFVALVIASAIEPFAARLKRWHIPRAFSVILVYIIALMVVAGIVYFFIPPMVTEISSMSFELPSYFKGISVPGSTDSLPAGTIVVSDLLENFRVWLTGFSSGTVSALLKFFGGTLSFLLVFIISFYLAVEENGIENFLRVVTPAQYEPATIDLWRRVQRKIGFWFQGQLLLMVIVGLLVFVGLSLINMKFALTLAVLAGLFEIIPIFGPIFSAIPAVFIGFSISPTLGFMTLGLYLIVQWLENHFIYPVVVNKIVGVPAIIVILSLAIGGELAGLIGVVLAVPAASLVLELFHDLEKRKSKEIA